MTIAPVNKIDFSKSSRLTINKSLINEDKYSKSALDNESIF